MQTILGSGGSIGIELAKVLKNYTGTIRLVSRNPKKINDSDELFPADLSDAEMVDKAIEGSDIVYLTIGFDYNIRTWRKKWPQMMRNTIDSCIKHNAKLVFFDNIYMYDKNFLNHMTEETPVNPSSKKGLVRTEISGMLLNEVQNGRITALIARSADFIGPKNSALIELVYKNLIKGKKANWFVDPGKIHNFTFVPDAAQATAILGNTPDAFNQVWHLPSISSRLTGVQWIGLFAKELKVEPRYSVLPVWLMEVIGLFVPVMGELKEMLYQYESDYFFDSSKFEKRFNFKAVSAAEAVRLIVLELGGG